MRSPIQPSERPSEQGDKRSRLPGYEKREASRLPLATSRDSFQPPTQSSSSSFSCVSAFSRSSSSSPLTICEWHWLQQTSVRAAASRCLHTRLAGLLATEAVSCQLAYEGKGDCRPTLRPSAGGQQSEQEGSLHRPDPKK